jgi:hypothetical protein
MYLRQNCPQEFLGDLCGVSQPTVSRIVTTLVPIVRSVLEDFVLSAEDAIEMVSGRLCLVDGTITPCWSWSDHDELWSRKHGTTGFNAQLVCLLNGAAVYISDPLPGPGRCSSWRGQGAGRQVPGFDEAIWARHRVEIVIRATRRSSANTQSWPST